MDQVSELHSSGYLFIFFTALFLGTMTKIQCSQFCSLCREKYQNLMIRLVEQVLESDFLFACRHSIRGKLVRVSSWNSAEVNCSCEQTSTVRWAWSLSSSCVQATSLFKMHSSLWRLDVLYKHKDNLHTPYSQFHLVHSQSNKFSAMTDIKLLIRIVERKKEYQKAVTNETRSLNPLFIERSIISMR